MPGKAALDKGKRAEREVCETIYLHLGFKCRRGQAGHSDDIGDIFGVPGHTIQVADWTDTMRAVREKPIAAQAQADMAGTPYACAWVRFRGGDWRVVMLPSQWADMARETL